jgi:cell division protein FtsI/penicillin-binding protein 2
MSPILSKFFFLTIIILLGSCAGNNALINKSILKDEYLRKIASNPDHEVQIIYTQVNKKDNTFKSYTYNVNSDKYFYPASTVKMPVAILALQKLNELNKNGTEVTRTDDMLTAAFRAKQIPSFTDSTTTSGKPNVERFIEKIFSVSDNNAYNRLYELLGQDYINQTLRTKGVFTKSVINHRLDMTGLDAEDNKHTNNIRFFRNNKILYDKPNEYAKNEWRHQATQAIKGVGYINNLDSLVNQPFDFSGKNFYTLKDMEGTLQRIIFPDYFVPNQRFDLKDGDYTFLKKCMSDLPKSYAFYKNNPEYYDSYVKYFLFGDSKETIPDDIKIYNKVGTAYGYLIDCAYIENTSKNIGFFLTAVIHVNNNKIYNDGKYEYNEIGLPFMAKLGKAVYDYELSRMK